MHTEHLSGQGRMVEISRCGRARPVGERSDPAQLPPRVRDDVQRFLDAFPDDHASWPAILAALRATFGRQVFRAMDLGGAVATHFASKA